MFLLHVLVKINKPRGKNSKISDQLFFSFSFWKNYWNYAICIYDSQHKINIEIVFNAGCIYLSFQGVTGNDGRPGEMGAPGIAGPAGVQGAQGNPGSRVSFI